MKRIFTISFLLILFSSNSQILSLEQFEKIYKLKTVEKKCDYLYGEDFTKESNQQNSDVKLVNKKFIKKTQAFDEELVIISKDTITYAMNDPKKYVKFKKTVDFNYKEIKDENSNVIIFRSKNEIIIVRETDEKREYSPAPVKFYNFSYYQIPKS